MTRPRLFIAATGAANLASVLAMCDRAGVKAIVTDDPDALRDAERVLLPGVGSFGAAMAALDRSGLATVLRERASKKKPLMGICLGMQMAFCSSEEDEGIPGLGIIEGRVVKFRTALPLPQLGWNRVQPGASSSLVKPGWAYFANSYRADSIPSGYSVSSSSYGGEFCAAVEAREPGDDLPWLLLCQFHPELSGAWGLDLFCRWMGLDGRKADAASISNTKPDAPPLFSSPRSTAARVIPCLDIKGGRVVKGVRFENLVDSGDPAELSLRYEREGADEIALLDISATIEERKTALDALKRVRAAVSIPISVGGGIKTVEDARRLLEAGADRVSVNSAAVRNPGLIPALAMRYGVQCVIAAIDAYSTSPGEWKVAIDAGRTKTGLDVRAWASACALAGAGEILLTSIDRDGTGLGYDLDLVSAVAEAAPIPLIASGGAAEPGHFLRGLEAGARAVLGAGVFHRSELSISDLKDYLARSGQEVRI